MCVDKHETSKFIWPICHRESYCESPPHSLIVKLTPTPHATSSNKQTFIRMHTQHTVLCYICLVRYVNLDRWPHIGWAFGLFRASIPSQRLRLLSSQLNNNIWPYAYTQFRGLCSHINTLHMQRKWKIAFRCNCKRCHIQS